jgi:hypothetical protein
VRSTLSSDGVSLRGTPPCHGTARQRARTAGQAQEEETARVGYRLILHPLQNNASPMVASSPFYSTVINLTSRRRCVSSPTRVTACRGIRSQEARRNVLVSTVTTTTVSTVTTVVMAESLGLVGAITLVVLLVQKGLIAVGDGTRVKVLVRSSNIAVAPLLMAFALSMVVKVLQILS